MGVKLKKTSMVKVIQDNQLYLYFNGELIFKKWINPRSYSKVFHNGERLTIKCK